MLNKRINSKTRKLDLINPKRFTSHTRTQYLLPDKAFRRNGESFVEYARHKLLYNELAPFFNLVSPQDTLKEVYFIRALRNQIPNSCVRLLDLACGVGRHARSLASPDLIVFGIDISEPEIALANHEANAQCKFEVADVRSWQVVGQPFDIAICMWSSFNYLSELSDRKQFFDRCFANLCPQGFLVIDVNNPYKSFSPHRTFGYSFPFEITQQSRKWRTGSIVVGEYTYKIVDVRSNRSVSLIDRGLSHSFELDNIIADADQLFTLEKVLGDYDLNSNYYRSVSDRMIVVLRRR